MKKSIKLGNTNNRAQHGKLFLQCNQFPTCTLSCHSTALHYNTLKPSDSNMPDKLGPHWFRKWFIACSATGQYLSQCCIIVNWDSEEQTSMKSISNYNNCQSGKYISKCHPEMFAILFRVCYAINTSGILVAISPHLCEKVEYILSETSSLTVV